jgi:hypothetical protein
VLKALTAKAKAGDNVSMRLFFELAGEFDEKPPVDHGVNLLEDLARKLRGE